MLQKYKFITADPVNKLQKEIEVFIRKIKSVKAADVFDPNLYFSKDFAKKIKARRKNKKSGRLEYGKLYKSFEAFFEKYKVLGTQKRVVTNCFSRMNDLNGLFNCSSTRKTIADLPPSIQNETKALFVMLYEDTLTSYGISKHYEAFSKKQGNNWCPFCGMEQLVHYTHQKEDYDHLLAKSIYPFAAVNMRNLFPMGQKCNRTHKKAKDIIFSTTKHIKAISPYTSSLKVTVDFNGTTLPSATGRRGKWQVAVTPNRPEVIHWDYVFNISDRIVKDYLTNGREPDYDVWLRDFINSHTGKALNTKKEVRNALIKYGQRFDTSRYRNTRYVQADLFKWIGLNAPDTFIEALQKLLK